MHASKRRIWAWVWVCLSGCAPQGTPAGPTIVKQTVGTTSLLRTQFGAFFTAREPELTLEGTQDDVAQDTHERGLFVVQYKQGSAAVVRIALAALGAEVHGYFPDDAWSISAGPDQVRIIATLDDVLAVSPLPVSLKLQQAMVRPGHRGLAWVQREETADLWVELSRAEDASVIESVVTRLGGNTMSEGSGMQIIRVRLPHASVSELARMPEVLALEAWSLPHATNDTSYGVLQSGEVARAPAWEHGLRGQNQIVGLSDSGVDTASCWFSGDKIAGYAEFTGIHDGDGSGHGTHVAGSIAANMGGDNGMHPHDGMAPEARLFVEDVGAGAALVGIPGDLGALFGPALEAGAHIHSNSWVGTSAKYGVMSRALDRFVAKHPDFVPVFAVGNTGRRGPGTVLEPAVAKNVVSVGAIDGADPQTVAEFSSRGPTIDGRIKPTIVAPGVAIASALAGAACDTQVLSGTSMAAPTAAGGLALLRQYYEEGFYPTGRATADNAITPSAALLRASLLAGAVDISGIFGKADENFGQGFGRMQLDRTMVFDGNASRLWLYEESQGLDDAQSMTFTVTVARAWEPLQVALAWTDPPALPGAGRALVNDLDLEVAGPDGIISLGNGDKDSDNVEERVSVPAAQAGVWRITVRASRVPMGPQSFALVATGEFAR